MSIRDRFGVFQSFLALCNGEATRFSRRRRSVARCISWEFEVGAGSDITSFFCPCALFFVLLAFPTKFGIEVDVKKDKQFTSFASFLSFSVITSLTAPLYPNLEDEVLWPEVFTQYVRCMSNCGHRLPRLFCGGPYYAYAVERVLDSLS